MKDNAMERIKDGSFGRAIRKISLDVYTALEAPHKLSVLAEDLERERSEEALELREELSKAKRIIEAIDLDYATLALQKASDIANTLETRENANGN